MRLDISPRAQDDTDTHAAHIAGESPQTARRFLVAARHTFGSLLKFPGRGKPRHFKDPALAGLRSWSVKGFPSHLVFYLTGEERILIVRVLHGAMNLESIFGPPKRAGRKRSKG